VKASVERFFQFSLLGLVTSGYFALAGSGYLDRPTLILTFLGLALRALAIAGVVRLPITPRHASMAAIAYLGFLPVDYYFLSRDFLTATVHGVCFLAVAKILTGQTARDYAFTGAISFLELIAAALLSGQSAFLAWLLVYTGFAIATLSSGEIRRSFHSDLPAEEVPGGGRLALRLGGLAAGATAAIILMTAGLFLAVPRTAGMTARLLPRTPRLTGFSNRIDLGGLGSISKDDRTVMHVRSYAHPLPPDVKWRGAALSRFDGRRWDEPVTEEARIPAAPRIAVLAGRLQLSRRDGQRMLYSVDLRNSSTGTLFLAGIPEFINIDSRAIVGSRSTSFRDTSPPRETLRYQVSAFWGPELPETLTAAERARYLRFPPLDVRILTLAREWAGEGTAYDRAGRIQYHLQHDFRYELDGPAVPVADPLADFLFVRKAGYCEYFASAMAVMLRTLGIPARVATGFAGGYFNDVSGVYVVRASDAHAWVEAFLPGPDGAHEGSWTSFDPTPALTGTAAQSNLVSRLSMYLEAADSAWHEWVVSYDLTRQATAAAQFEALLRRFARPEARGSRSWRQWLVDLAREWGIWLLVALSAAILLFFFGPELWKNWRGSARIRRIARAGGSSSDASLLYQQMLDRLARRGLNKPAWATPAEFAAQLEGRLPPEQGLLAARFTELYNAVRFGGDAAAAARMAGLLREFDRMGRMHN